MTMELGLTNHNNNIKYLNIFEGTFRLKVPAGTENAVERVNKNGETVHELVYRNVAGYIKNLYIKKTDFGRRFNLLLGDGSSLYCIQLGYADYMAVAIYKMLPNIVDPTQPVKVSLSRKPNEKGKEVTSIFISQEVDGNEVSVKHFYNKENPNGMPELEDVMIKGEPTKDNTKQVEFLVENALLPFMEKIGVQQREEEDVQVEYDEEQDQFFSPSEVGASVGLKKEE